MQSLAAREGCVVQKKKPVDVEFASSIAARMGKHLGKEIRQVGQFDLPLSRSYLESLNLPVECRSVDPPPNCVEWDMTTVEQLVSALKPLLSDHASGYRCAGISRALKSASEKKIYSVSTLMPTMELSGCLLARGVERTRVQFMYILTDQEGSVHAPRDEKNRIIAIESNLKKELRSQLKVDLNEMADRGWPLADGFWRMIGREPPPPPVRATRPIKYGPKKRGREPKTVAGFEIEEILEERKAAGRAKAWVLVRWAGYDPAWEPWRISGEVGEPLQTWEPRCNVMGTSAWKTWLEREE